jgi:hypothetical protein
MGAAVAVVHIINLHSFGIPHVSLTGNLKNQEVKDTFIRAPLWQMKQRPPFASNKTRMKGKGND